jgi:hypothetical protein
MFDKDLIKLSKLNKALKQSCTTETELKKKSFENRGTKFLAVYIISMQFES